MKEVQLDKNSNSRKLRESCNEQGLVDCFSLPRLLLDSGDDKIIEFAILKQRLLVTFDREIAYDYPQCVSPGCPGILILAHDDGAVQRMTDKSAMKMLAKLKSELPGWPALVCTNSIVQVQPSIISVNHIAAGSVRLSGYEKRSTDGWQLRVQALLQGNLQSLPTSK